MTEFVDAQGPDEGMFQESTLPLKSVVTPTGEARVDSAMQRLQDSEDLPVEEQIAIFEDVHRRLSDALSDLQN